MKSLKINFQSREREIKYEVSNSDIILEIPDLKEDEYYKVFRNGKPYFTAVSYSSQIVLTNQPAGENTYIIEIYSGNTQIDQCKEFNIKIESLDAYFTTIDSEIVLCWSRAIGAEQYGIYRQTAKNLFTLSKDYDTNFAVLYGYTHDDEVKIKPYRKENVDKIFDYPIKKIQLNKDITSTYNNWTFDINVKEASATITWKKIANANNYKIYSVSDNKKELISEIENNYYKKTMIPSGHNGFCIEAYDYNNLVSTSAVVICEINSVEVKAVNKDKRLTLYWNKVPNADGYRIFKKNTKTQEFEGFVSATEEKSHITNFIPGETCEYKVKPYILKNGERIYSDLAGKCKLTISKTSKIDLVVNEAYNNQIALSWYYDGDADGFEIVKNNELLEDLKDGLAHIYMSDGLNDEYQIKGYKIIKEDKIYTCSSKKVSIKNSYRDKIPAPKSYKVSVIIPAYNSQDYISRTISTVMASSIDDVELLIVDDGSKDNTRDIIIWYSQKYPNFIKGIFKENGGVADTRNKGIEAATGKYIAFMDNDDMIRPHGFETMYKAIENSKADVLIAPLYRIENDFYNKRLALPFEKNTRIDIEEYLRIIFSKSYSNIGVWNKLYKSEIVKEHPFGLLAYEDVSWTPYILSWCDNFCCIDEVCYEWDRKIRPSTFSGVLSGRSADEKSKDRYEAVKFFLENGNPNRRAVLAYLYAKRMYAQGEKHKHEKYFDAIKEIRTELVNNRFLWEDKEYYPKIMPLILDNPTKTN